MAKTPTPTGKRGRPKIEKKFEVSKELRDLAEDVMKKEGLDLEPPAKLEYLLVYPSISKRICGRCNKSGKLLKFFSNFDYVIEMSGELWDKLDDKNRYVLMYHELLHAHPAMNEKSGNWEFKIRDHDIQDFAVIVKKYGIDWVGNVKTLASSVYELEPKDEELLTL